MVSYQSAAITVSLCGVEWRVVTGNAVGKKWWTSAIRYITPLQTSLGM